MNVLAKIRIQFCIGLLWVLYVLYLIVFQNLLLFPKDTYELLIPAVIQILFFLLFKKLFSEKYEGSIKLISLICCGLVILWHFSFIYSMPQSLINSLFVIAPIFSIAIFYIRAKAQKESKISVLRQLGVLLSVGFVNFIIGVFSFYIFHYWI